ncbi:hypothetical protein [Phaeovulum sp.]|uniref:hypothetical protein n=1 Tax=Phaeovulum sp. TaxID=2934796 RepID=UPI0039E533E5
MSVSSDNKGIGCPIDTNTPSDNKAKNPALSNGKTKNPDALAGAIGADQKSSIFDLEEYRLRAMASTLLIQAIADCHPLDAALLMSAALDDMRVPVPPVPLINAMDEAKSWAKRSTPAEHKAYALVCFQAMPAKDQAAFLAYVQKEAGQ